MSEPPQPPSLGGSSAESADAGSFARVRVRDPAQTQELATRPLPERYRDLAILGRGGAGEVRRVLDRTLNRVVAVKVLREELAQDVGMVRRFMHEAQVVAQLAHPAIVPVHDLGQLADGRWYLTMKEVQGRTLREVIAAVHAARKGGAFVPTADGWTLRRLLDAFGTVCEAVGFAHSRGVLHRDLKPDNVMVGDYGEVYVLDWGLAKVLAQPEPPPLDGAALSVSTDARASRTRHGIVVGTPAYMPPEQARGDGDAVGPWSDVWSLGAILYAILYGRPPYRGTADQVLAAVQAAPPPVVTEIPVPAALVDLWATAMRMDPSARYPHGAAFAAEVGAWLEGSRAREKALVVLEAARASLPALAEALERATRSRERARAAVVSLRASDPLDTKESAWALEDVARGHQESVDRLYQELSTRARLALAESPDLPEARAFLADLYRQRAEAAEAVGDAAAAREHQAMLAEYDDGRHAAFLRSEGELHLDTLPRGASVRVLRYESRARRTIPVAWAETGPTPLASVLLPVGSWLLELRAAGRAPVRYPVRITRNDPWRPVAPGRTRLHPVALPPAGAVRADECFVPAGWFVAGGDAEAPGALPRQRLWVDDFSLATRPVTHEEYLFYLNELTREGRVDEARRRAAALPSKRNEGAVSLHRLDASSGRWVLEPEAFGLPLGAKAPVVGVSWFDANAFCRWAAERTGLPWRLPGELEREKAARGVDGRSFPWGEASDPAFHCMMFSNLPHPGAPPTDDFPLDDSPYGVRGLAGGVQEWCADLFRPEGPDRHGSRVAQPAVPGRTDTEPRPLAPRRVLRGGAWNLRANNGRAAARAGLSPDRRADNLGFRLCRGWPAVDTDPSA